MHQPSPKKIEANATRWRAMTMEGTNPTDIDLVVALYKSGLIAEAFASELIAGLPHRPLPADLVAMKPDATEAEMAAGIVVRHQARTPAGPQIARTQSEDVRSRHPGRPFVQTVKVT